MSNEAQELIERARKLAPLLAEHSAEAERIRKPVDSVMRAIEDAGIFRLMVPRRLGGLELDLDTFLEVGLALSEGDASMAWVTTFCIEHNWMLCQFPEAFQEELYADHDWILAPGSIAPNGRAKTVEGGYELSGRWQWATGVMHSSWVIVGASVGQARSGPPDFRFFALPVNDVEVEDTWYVDGMCGTGSNDVVIDSVFVPEHRTVSMIDMSLGRAHGAALHPTPLYRTPMLPILGLAASMPAVGQARAAVRAFRERIGQRVIMGGQRQAEKPAAQIRLARVEIEVRQAESLLRDLVREVCELRENATIEDRARWLAFTAYAVHQSRSVLASIAEASGASAHFQSDPLQRAVRDLNTLSTHAVFDLDNRLEIHGRVLLGLDPGGMV